MTSRKRRDRQARRDLDHWAAFWGHMAMVDLAHERATTRLDDVRELLAGAIALRTLTRRHLSNARRADQERTGVPAAVASFTAVVSFGESGRPSIWLPELAIYGQGDSFADATEDLIDEVLQYVKEWRSELETAPNHRGRAPFVEAIEAAGDRDSIRDLLFRTE